MNSDLLLDNLAAIAAGPGGVDRVWELVLALAFRGKLVPQESSDRSDSPSKAERAGPFALPPGWRWTTLKNCTKTWKQKVPDRPFTYIDVASIDNIRGQVGTDLKIIEPKDAPSRARKIVKEGTVIFSTVRPYLKNVAIIERDYQPEPIVSTAFSVLHPLENINNRFLFHYLRSPAFMEHVSAEMTGMAYPAITDRKLLDAPIPIPPLVEQRRIVEKVDRLMALCDDLEARQQAEREERRRLRTASFTALEEAATAEEAERAWAHVASEFGRLVDTVEDVAELRILSRELAVRGILNGSSSAEESATKLVEKIAEERRILIHEGVIKPNESPPIDEQEVPYPLPLAWCWCRLSELLVFGPRNGLSPKPVEHKTSTRTLTLSAVTKGTFNSTCTKYIGEEIDRASYLWVKDGDILIERSNTQEYVGISALYEGENDQFIYPDLMMKLRLSSPLNSVFVQMAMNSKISRVFFRSRSTGTSSTMKKISQQIVRDLPIPLPPLDEQNRIVEKIGRLMAVCDGLEATIRTRDAALEAFAGAACRAVLDGADPVSAPAPAVVGAIGQQRLPV